MIECINVEENLTCSERLEIMPINLITNIKSKILKIVGRCTVIIKR